MTMATARDNSSTTHRVASSDICTTPILRVWNIVNTHFESLIATADRSNSKSRAEINIQSQVKEMQDLMGTCSRRLNSIEAYISELHIMENVAVNDCPLQQPLPSELAGEWHFLYMEDNSIFGYMKLVPGSISVNPDNGSTPVKRGEFTIPSGVAREANEVTDETFTWLDNCYDYAQCPCCQISFKVSKFWKHALFEIADRGHRVPAWQSLTRSDTPRWIVEGSAGWNNPIYRPRSLESTCEIGQCFAELNVKHFLSDYDFSRALDSAFEFLALQLKN